MRLDRLLLLALLMPVAASFAQGADPPVPEPAAVADDPEPPRAEAGKREVPTSLADLRSKDGQAVPTIDDLRGALPQGFIVGAAAVHIPDRFADNERNFYAFPGFVYLGDRFTYLGDRALYTLLRGRQVSLNATARYRFARLDRDGVPEFGTLGRRSDQLELGLGVTALTRVGFFAASVAADASGRSNGQTAQASWFLPILRGRLLVMPSIGVAWYDDSFSNYYHGGVFPDEASPVLPAFDTGSTTALTSNLVLGWRITPKWFVSVGAVHFRFSDNLEDSPILLDRSQTSLFTAVGYIWD